MFLAKNAIPVSAMGLTNPSKNEEKEQKTLPADRKHTGSEEFQRIQIFLLPQGFGWD